MLFRSVIARRFINLAAHGRFFLTNSDLLWRSKFFVTLRNQSRVLARTLPLAPEGMPRLEAAVGLVIAGLALNDDMSVAQGLTRLDGELARQFLPDGGHVGRSPEMLARSFQLLAMLTQGLEITGHVVPDSLRGALDRMALALRFFRMGDGGLSVVNGGGESDPRLVTSLLERSDIQGPPYGHSPHSGYQRLAAGRAIVVFDVGPPPPGPFSIEAHAGCLAFEFSSGNQRVVVNCGSARPDMERATENWATALRRTAAHSTLTLADTSSAVVLPAGFLRDTLGPQLFDGPQYVETAREELAEGTLATGKQDGYLVRFGIAHERRVVLSTKGHTLTGVDCLSPLPSRRGRGRRQPPVLNFAIRFHIHPDIRLSLAQNGGSVILKLPSGEGWRFRCGGGNLAIEESIYLGSGRVRRTEQLVVTGTVRDDVVECAWVFENMAAQ